MYECGGDVYICHMRESPHHRVAVSLSTTSVLRKKKKIRKKSVRGAKGGETGWREPPWENEQARDAKACRYQIEKGASSSRLNPQLWLPDSLSRAIAFWSSFSRQIFFFFTLLAVVMNFRCASHYYTYEGWIRYLLPFLLALIFTKWPSYSFLPQIE